MEFSPEELTFAAVSGSSQVQRITARNNTSKPQLFKVRTTAPKFYTVYPNTAVVAPGHEQDIVVTRSPNEDFQGTRDKFLLLAFPIDGVPEQADLHQLWADLEPSNKSHLTSRKITVQFIDTPEVSGKRSSASAGGAPVANRQGNEAERGTSNRINSTKLSASQGPPQDSASTAAAAVGSAPVNASHQANQGHSKQISQDAGSNEPLGSQASQGNSSHTTKSADTHGLQAPQEHHKKLRESQSDEYQHQHQQPHVSEHQPQEQAIQPQQHEQPRSEATREQVEAQTRQKYEGEDQGVAGAIADQAVGTTTAVGATAQRAATETGKAVGVTSEAPQQPRQYSQDNTASRLPGSNGSAGLIGQASYNPGLNNPESQRIYLNKSGADPQEPIIGAGEADPRSLDRREAEENERQAKEEMTHRLEGEFNEKGKTRYGSSLVVPEDKKDKDANHGGAKQYDSAKQVGAKQQFSAVHTGGKSVESPLSAHEKARVATDAEGVKAAGIEKTVSGHASTAGGSYTQPGQGGHQVPLRLAVLAAVLAFFLGWWLR